AMTAKLTPFPVPRVTRVTVGGRPARDPQSYLNIFGAGKVWFSAILPHWLRISFTADAPSPWTDGADDYFISAQGTAALARREHRQDSIAARATDSRSPFSRAFSAASSSSLR